MAALPAAMFEIFRLKLQAPRSTSTTLPASVPAANAAHPFRLPPAPLPYWTGTLIFASSAAIGLDHDCATASVGTIGPPLTERPIAKPVEDGTAVWATEIADLAEDGEPAMYGLSPLLPADATTSVPAALALSDAAERSSSRAGPYGEPSDMLMMSAASEVEPSPLGSIAKSMPWMRATPEQAVLTEEQILTARSFARGATPSVPAMMSATCDPWVPSQTSLIVGPQGMGSGSGASGPLGHASPTKSYPPMTFAVGNSFTPL